MSTERQIVMTVYKIQADLIEITEMGGPERYVPGATRVYAQGDGEFHNWQIHSDQRWWIGDTVTVTILEDDPEPAESTPLTPPPIDKRER